MTQMSTAHVHALIKRLITARATREPIDNSDCDALQLVSRAGAYFVQDEIWRSTWGVNGLIR